MGHLVAICMLSGMILQMMSQDVAARNLLPAGSKSGLLSYSTYPGRTVGQILRGDPTKGHHHRGSSDDFREAKATCYGGKDASETMGGACGYGNLYTSGYGTMTTALSTILFRNGTKCGACFLVVCKHKTQCKHNRSVTVSTTNFCPPTWDGSPPHCNPPNEHFDLSQPAFELIANYDAGIIPVAYKRVPCYKDGGVKFTVNGNPWVLLVLVINVSGNGVIKSLSAKTGATNWILMERTWGMNWSVNKEFVGHKISFRIVLEDGNVHDLWDIIPEWWQFGQTYDGPQLS